MSDMEEIRRKHYSEDFIQELMDAAQSIAVCEKGINKATEKITKSFNTQGTRGADHKSLLLTKITDLKRLSGLYRSVSEKYVDAAVKLTDGVSEDKVLAELHPYNVFLNDQMESEKECYEQVLNMLRD